MPKHTRRTQQTQKKRRYLRMADLFFHPRFRNVRVALIVHMLVAAVAVPILWHEFAKPYGDVQGAPVTVTLTTGSDTKINLAATTTNYANDNTMEIQRSAGSNVRRVLVKFDLSSIPSNAIVESATLKLFQSGSGSGLTGVQQGAYRVTRSWTSGQTTWNKADSGNNWTSAGGDFDSSASGTMTPASNGSNGTERNFNVTTDTGAFVTGSLTNNGWVIKFSTDTVGPGLTQTYHSFESATSGFRPQLTVTYIIPSPPVLANTSGEQQPGSDLVYLTVEASDEDTDKLIMRVYNAGGSCTSDTGQLTLDPTVTTTLNDSGGAPDVNASNYYQVGSTSGRQIVTTGINTIQLIWNAATDIPNTEGIACVGWGVNDGASGGYQSASTTLNVVIDTKAPATPGSLNSNPIVSTSSVIFGGWGGACSSYDANFFEYKLHYDTSPGVTINSAAWTSSTHEGLGARSVGVDDLVYGTCPGIDGTTVFTGLQTGTTYYANLFAYDSFGHAVSSTSERSFTTDVAVPGTPTVVASTTNALSLIINTAGNASTVTYSICKTDDGVVCGASGGYVQADGSLGASAVWQTYGAWGGINGVSITGLLKNTPYRFLVRARRGDGEGTINTSPSSTETYIHASQVNNLAITNATVTSTLGIQLSWESDASQSGLKIERDNGCDGTYDVSIYDNSAQMPSSPTTTVANLSGGTCYQFRFASYNENGALNTISRPVTSMITTPPTQPQDVTALSTTGSAITWQWTLVSGADSYDIYNSETGARLGSVDGTRQFEQTGLSPNSQSSIIVRARNANGTGIASTAASGYTDANTPNNLSHSNQTTTALRWTWSSGGVQDGYYAFDTNNASDNSGWINSAFWDQSGLSANTAYTVGVKARSGGGEETNDTRITRYTSQNTPTSLSFSSVYETGVTVTVNGTFPNLGVGSALLHIDNGAGTTQDLTGVTSWANSGLTPNTQYTYTAYAQNGDGDQTSTVSNSTYTLAQTPGSVSITASSPTSVTLTLDRNGNPANTNVRLSANGSYVDTTGMTLTGTVGSFDTFANWASPVITGLTPNTLYSFLATARNGDGILSNSSTANGSVYTLANVPANPRVEANSGTQVTLTWGLNGNPVGTEYYAENTTLGMNTGWMTAATWSLSNLTCDTNYAFQVKARNADGIETTAETVSGQTNSCTSSGGSGIPLSLLQKPRAPQTDESFTVTINGNASTTVSSLVTLSLDGGPDAARMSISEDPSFVDAVQQNYQKQVVFRLSDTAEKKRVYVRFYTAMGVASPIVSDEITLVALGKAPTIEVPVRNAKITALPFEVSGIASPLSTVTATIAGTQYTVTSDMNGRYSVTILDQLTPGSYTITVSEVTQEGNLSKETTLSISYLTTLIEDRIELPVEQRPQQPTTNQSPTIPSPSSAPVTVTAPTARDVDSMVKKIMTERSAFLVVRTSASTQFERDQVGAIEVSAGRSFDVTIRPHTPVHSVTARLYKTGSSVSYQQDGIEPTSLFSRVVSWIRPTAHAATKKTIAPWEAAFVFVKPENGGVYGGTIQLPSSIPSGSYRLVLTLNGVDSSRTHLTKQVSVLAKGELSGINGEKVTQAKITVYRQKVDNTYEIWPGDAFGQKNPILTDADGQFLIYVPSGTYYLTIDSPGFEPYKSGVYIFDEPAIFHESVRLTPKKQDALYRAVSWIIGLFGR